MKSVTRLYYTFGLHVAYVRYKVYIGGVTDSSSSAKRDRRERFVSLAEARMGKALQSIRLIGNLSNKSNYEYSERDVQKIIRALNAEVDEVRRRFKSDDQGNRPTFKID